MRILFKENATERMRRKGEWHRWFAWYPVLLRDGKTLVWLEEIERRKNYGCWGTTSSYRCPEVSNG